MADGVNLRSHRTPSFPSFSCSSTFGLHISSSMTINDERLRPSDRGGQPKASGRGKTTDETKRRRERERACSQSVHGTGRGKKIKKEDQPGW